MPPNVQFTDIYPDGAGAAAAAAPVTIVPPATPYPDLPAQAIPFDRDLTITAAGTYVVFDPGVGYKFFLVSAFVSTDTAMRVALVDDADLPNQRPVAGYFGANGGASPNLVPKWYESKLAGNKLRAVTAGAGNVQVRVSGFTLPA